MHVVLGGEAGTCSARCQRDLSVPAQVPVHHLQTLPVCAVSAAGLLSVRSTGCECTVAGPGHAYLLLWLEGKADTFWTPAATSFAR